jgi:arylsulfatase
MFVHEGGISTPLIAYWPDGIKRAGAITSEIAHVMDIMPTVCDLAGVEYPGEFQGESIQPTEGRSLLPTLQGRRQPEHRHLFWEHHGHRAVRQDRWKLVGCRDGAWELYDLEADRSEMNDLAARMPEKVRELAEQHNRWVERCQAGPPASLR